MSDLENLARFDDSLRNGTHLWTTLGSGRSATRGRLRVGDLGHNEWTYRHRSLR